MSLRHPHRTTTDRTDGLTTTARRLTVVPGSAPPHPADTAADADSDLDNTAADSDPDDTDLDNTDLDDTAVDSELDDSELDDSELDDSELDDSAADSDAADRQARRRSRSSRPRSSAPRVAVDGGRRQAVDSDEHDPLVDDEPALDLVVGRPGETGTPAEDLDPTTAPLSSYDVADRGPGPVPDWLITDLSARDTDLGVLKTGKEADVHLLERALDHGPGCLLAVKRYRSSHHRQFHRDSSYQEGRRTRRSRETRALAGRTTFGRELLAGKWAAAEFDALGRLWQAGAAVPYPVQLLGTELMMEFIGEPDGAAAPRLADWCGSPDDFTALWHDLVATLDLLAEHGWAHGDLSPFNILVHQGRCVLIDLPQVVDVVTNPQGPTFLERDARTVARFFARRGVQAADADLLVLRLTGLMF